MSTLYQQEGEAEKKYEATMVSLPEDASINIPLQEPPAAEKNEKPPAKKRIIALDILRGATIMLMIMVNNQPGGGFDILEHAEWHGMTPTDCVFPFFLWITGYAIGITFKDVWTPKKSNQDTERVRKFCWLIPMSNARYEQTWMWLKIIRRSITLWLIGFTFAIIGKNFNFTIVRLSGVMQRISLCYFSVTAIYVFFPWFWMQCVIVAALQVAYMIIMFGVYVPYPYCQGRGMLTPECSAEALVDQTILTRNHIYQFGHYDPEGLVSNLSAITNTFMGVVAFKIAYSVAKSNNEYKRIALWFVSGFTAVVIGMVMHFTFLPLNKKIWTTSFALTTSGLASMMLALITFVVDIQGYQRIWIQPFLWVGSNPLVMYVVPTFIVIIMIKIPVFYGNAWINLYSFFFKAIFASWIKSAKLASMLFGICYELIFWPLALFLFWRKIFITI